MAQIEAAAVALTVTLFASVTLVVTHLAFTRAWFEYVSEQALYCLAEDRPVRTCRAHVVRATAGLPFVRVERLSLARAHDKWRIQLRWIVQRYAFRLDKHLDERRIRTGGGLRS